MNLETLNTKMYSITHLSESDGKDIQNFYISNQKGKGLEVYLKRVAMYEEKENIARTYIIRDNYTNEIAAYFTLRTGLITQKTKLFYFDNMTGIELANFGANDHYWKAHDVIPRLGTYIFTTFVIPIISDVHDYVGIKCGYLAQFKVSESKDWHSLRNLLTNNQWYSILH